MKALTITQPWAGLVASGVKLVENRPWKPWSAMLGNQFAIHASRAIDENTYQQIHEAAPELYDFEEDGKTMSEWHRLSRVKSAVIAVATLVTWVTHPHQLTEYFGRKHAEQRRWFSGPFGFVLRDVRVLAEPVPCKGALAFWQLGSNEERKVLEQLDLVPPPAREQIGLGL